VDFELTEQQQALGAMARHLFAKVSPPARLRSVWEGAERGDDAWQAMADQGLLGLLVPESHGGAGGDTIDLLVVLKEAGRAALPEPLLETACIVAGAVAQAGSDEQRTRWLPPMSAGQTVASVLLSGQPYVVDADLADVLLVEDGHGLRLVETGRFSAEPVPGEDRSRRLFAVEVDPGAGERLPGDAGVARDLAAFGTAALLVGVGVRLLEMTLEHVKVRHQFGQPVGAFQAVKHKLATVFATLESARAATRYAAYASALGLPDRAAAARVAKVQAAEAAALANTETLQCHGGIGFTWEHDLHLWLKRGRALEHAYGSAREHRAALAAMLFDDERM
jgi:alkylation response protein AidB-like acyl-CoA dehydrogenase